MKPPEASEALDGSRILLKPPGASRKLLQLPGSLLEPPEASGAWSQPAEPSVSERLLPSANQKDMQQHPKVPLRSATINYKTLPQEDPEIGGTKHACDSNAGRQLRSQAARQAAREAAWQAPRILSRTIAVALATVFPANAGAPRPSRVMLPCGVAAAASEAPEGLERVWPLCRRSPRPSRVLLPCGVAAAPKVLLCSRDRWPELGNILHVPPVHD